MFKRDKYARDNHRFVRGVDYLLLVFSTATFLFVVKTADLSSIIVALNFCGHNLLFLVFAATAANDKFCCSKYSICTNSNHASFKYSLHNVERPSPRDALSSAQILKFVYQTQQNSVIRDFVKV